MFWKPSFNLLGGRWHSLEGSPTYPSRQAHFGTWFSTLQTALIPQVPGQGSLHLALMHARLDGQSVFKTHSGRQERYGSPCNPGRHLQAAARPSSEHSALSPQGLGSQGLTTGSGVGVAKSEKVALNIGHFKCIKFGNSYSNFVNRLPYYDKWFLMNKQSECH